MYDLFPPIHLFLFLIPLAPHGIPLCSALRPTLIAPINFFSDSSRNPPPPASDGVRGLSTPRSTFYRFEDCRDSLVFPHRSGGCGSDFQSIWNPMLPDSTLGLRSFFFNFLPSGFSFPILYLTQCTLRGFFPSFSGHCFPHSQRPPTS